MKDDLLNVAGRSLRSRLIVGTGKYASLEQMRDALAASGADMVTVAVRRVDLKDRSSGSFWASLPEHMIILPNTAGCYTAEDAVRVSRLARELLDTDLIKLEVLGSPETLLPDAIGLLEATKELVRDGFKVMAYTSDDPVLAKRLEDEGVAAVMPLAAPIGSGLGIQNKVNLQYIRRAVTRVPLIVDAGVGSPADAAAAMELGVDGVLMNTAIAAAQDPVAMARAMAKAVEAGREGFLAGPMPRRPFASASSPSAGSIAAAPART